MDNGGYILPNEFKDVIKTKRTFYRNVSFCIWCWKPIPCKCFRRFLWDRSPEFIHKLLQSIYNRNFHQF